MTTTFKQQNTPKKDLKEEMKITIKELGEEVIKTEKDKAKQIEMLIDLALCKELPEDIKEKINKFLNEFDLNDKDNFEAFCEILSKIEELYYDESKACVKILESDKGKLIIGGYLVFKSSKNVLENIIETLGIRIIRNVEIVYIGEILYQVIVLCEKDEQFKQKINSEKTHKANEKLKRLESPIRTPEELAYELITIAKRKPDNRSGC